MRSAASRAIPVRIVLAAASCAVCVVSGAIRPSLPARFLPRLLALLLPLLSRRRVCRFGRPGRLSRRKRMRALRRTRQPQPGAKCQPEHTTSELES